MNHHSAMLRALCIAWLVIGSWMQTAHEAVAQSASPDWTEQDYLSEIPAVYSASRLPQPQQDAAGATTVLDQEFIRMTGARDLAEVFRWVAGFQVATVAGGRSVVAYHGLSGDVSRRMQVYVDGRSVYAPYLFGGVDWSSVAVPLDEIERIEIQRGSNSVTYGANAFLGVIHIVTRAAAQSVGVRGQILQGNQGIADRHVRWGHAQESAQWRLAAGQRSDEGLLGRSNGFRTDYIDMRAEFQPSVSGEWSIFSGFTRSRRSTGFEGRVADPLRRESAESAFVQARYRHTVDPGQEWSLALSSSRESGDDSFTIPLLGQGSINIDGRRRASRYTLDYQHFNNLSARWRASWGLGLRREGVTAPQLFATSAEQNNSSWFGFLNMEWKPDRHWTLNIGALVERDGLSVSQWAPRLAVNWKPSAAHALKLGYSSAFRSPSLFEQRADWRISHEGTTLDIRYLSSGGLVPERVRSIDLVYLGRWPQYRLTLDARLFEESFARLITGELIALPAQAAGSRANAGASAYDLRNNVTAVNRGIEYQLGWRPVAGTLLSLNQYFARPEASSWIIARSMPRRSTAIQAAFALPDGWSMGAGYASVSPMLWLGEATPAGAQKLAYLQVSRSMRVRGAKLDLMAVWRQPIGRFDEFRELQAMPRKFWVSLAVEY